MSVVCSWRNEQGKAEARLGERARGRRGRCVKQQNFLSPVSHCLLGWKPTAMRPNLVLQDGHLVPLLPKGASIFLSMTLQRLLRRWEKKARMASMPVRKPDYVKHYKISAIWYQNPVFAVCGLPFLGLPCSYISLVTLYANVVPWRLLQAENHRRQSVAALQKAGNVRSRLAAFEANLRLGAHQAPLPCTSPSSTAASFMLHARLLLVISDES